MISSIEIVEKIDSLTRYHSGAGTSMSPTGWPWGFLSSIKQQSERGKKLTSRQLEVLNEILEKWSPESHRAKADEEEAWQHRFDSDPTVQQDVRWVIDSLNATSLVDIARNRDWCFRCDVIKSGYWTSIRTRYDETGRITKKDYERLIGNKYSQSLINGMRGDRKFDMGALVAVRASGAVKTLGGGKGGGYHQLSSAWGAMRDRHEVISFDVEKSKNSPGTYGCQRVLLEASKNGAPLLGMVVQHDPVPSLSNASGCRTYQVMTIGALQEVSPMLILEERWMKKAPKNP